jgi:hypothetical protein
MELLLIFLVYLLPSFIAAARKHHQGGSILIINIFLGWTFLGWVIALAMSVGHVKKAVI